jgi:hypothetical protein
MSNSYSVSSSPALSSTLVGIYGAVNSTYIFLVVYKTALDEAFAASGQLGIENYLAPLMLATSQAFYQSSGCQNPTVNSVTPLLAVPGTSYPNMPSSWTA